MTVQQPNIVKCKYCLNSEIIESYSNGDIVCTMCGLVLQDKIIDPGIEYRTFDVISKIRVEQDEDIYQQFSHTLLRSPIRVNMSSTIDRNQIEIYKEVDNITSILQLNDTTKRIAKTIYKNLMNSRSNKKIHCLNRELATALVVVACKQTHFGRSFKEICLDTKVSKRSVGRIYLTYLKPVVNMTNNSAAGFIPRFVHALHLPFTIERQSLQLLTLFESRYIFNGRQPNIVAAIIIYTICQCNDLNKTFNDLSQVTKLNAKHLKSIYEKEILVNHHKLLQTELLDITGKSFSDVSSSPSSSTPNLKPSPNLK